MRERLTRRETLQLLGALSLVPLETSAAQQPRSSPESPAQTSPDLGNLHPMLEWISRENAPRLSFLDPQWKTLDEWKRAARLLVRQWLSYEPKPLPLGAELLAREERDGFTLESVRIRATPAYDIPAWVLVPSRRSGRVPGVVALHCHGGEYVFAHEKILSRADEPAHIAAYRERLYGRPYAEALARRGHVVLAIDAFYFGLRRLRVEDLETKTAPGDVRGALEQLRTLPEGTLEWARAVNGLCRQYEHLTAKTIFAAGATWPGILTWDDARSVDYLSSRPEVDASRIGCVGLSLGGIRAARLAGFDPRVKASVVVGWMPEFQKLLPNHIKSHTWMAYLPGLAASLDLPDVAALTAPGALLVQQCARDSLYPTAAMRSANEKLERIYAKAGIPERFRGVFHDEPHSFTPAMQDEAFAWLERWL
jgi:dienelactone hydrolase